MPEFLLRDEQATLALGHSLADVMTPGSVIALHGDLGAGKTTLARGLIRALCGADTEVQSPTYTLVHSYQTPFGELHHLDLYRLENPEDVTDLAWDDLLQDAMLIEWPDRASDYLPQDRLDLELSSVPGGRLARLCPCGEAWQEKLHLLEFSE